MNISEHDVVALTRDLPEHALQVGDVGTVVHVYEAGRAYEVEFMTGSGKTLAVATLEAASVRSLADNEVLHARSVAAA